MICKFFTRFFLSDPPNWPDAKKSLFENVNLKLHKVSLSSYKAEQSDLKHSTKHRSLFFIKSIVKNSQEMSKKSIFLHPKCWIHPRKSTPGGATITKTIPNHNFKDNRTADEVGGWRSKVITTIERILIRNFCG